MQGLLYFLAFAAGLLLVLQVGMNSTLRAVLDSPLAAALVSFIVGTLALALYMLVTRAPWPARAQLAAVPGWAWYGGVFGAFYVVTSVVVGPRLGAATLLSLIVLGQLLTSLLVDHFGWVGFPQHPVSLVRLTGAVLLFAGVLLITR
jgi:transporter family-2 protein